MSPVWLISTGVVRIITTRARSRTISIRQDFMDWLLASLSIQAPTHTARFSESFRKPSRGMACCYRSTDGAERITLLSREPPDQPASLVLRHWMPPHAKQHWIGFRERPANAAIRSQAHRSTAFARKRTVMPFGTTISMAHLGDAGFEATAGPSFVIHARSLSLRWTARRTIQNAFEPCPAREQRLSPDTSTILIYFLSYTWISVRVSPFAFVDWEVKVMTFPSAEMTRLWR